MLMEITRTGVVRQASSGPGKSLFQILRVGHVIAIVADKPVQPMGHILRLKGAPRFGLFAVIPTIASLFKLFS
jgi:hypothetical protein